MKVIHKNRQKKWFVLLSVAILAALFGLWTHYNLKSQAQSAKLEVATIYPQPRLIKPFKLTDTEGKPFTLENLKGHYSLVFFGFTHCPSLCPTTLATLNQSYQLMEAAKIKTLPQIVFISVDPERDTPSVIKTYLSSFNKVFLGATGTTDQVDELTQEMSVLYTKVTESGDPGHYTIDHSGTLILVDTKGQVAGVFTMPHDAEKIAHDMQSIVSI